MFSSCFNIRAKANPGPKHIDKTSDNSEKHAATFPEATFQTIKGALQIILQDLNSAVILIYLKA